MNTIENLKEAYLKPIPIEVGATASFTKTITEEDLVAFALVSTDVNPLHLDDDYAKQTRFGSRIAHGVLSASFISAVIGNQLPGPGAIYLSQNLSFKAPVRLNDSITTTATVIAKKENREIYTLETICSNQDGIVVTEGEAVVMFEPITEHTAS